MGAIGISILENFVPFGTKENFPFQKKLFFTLFFYIGVYITPAHMYFFFNLISYKSRFVIFLFFC